MVLYHCENCLKEFKQKGHYMRHLNRKYPCKNNRILSHNVDDPSQKWDGNNICKYCNKKYKQKQHLTRHLKTCKLKLEDDKKQKLYDLLVKKNNKNLEEQNLYLKQQINLLQEQLKLAKNINSNNVINSHNINNINIVAFNKTDLSHITDKDFEYIMKRCNMCIPKLIEKTHYDSTKPENKNIFISNIKDKYIMKWDGLKWNLNNREDTLEDLYENSSNILEDRIETWEFNKFQYDPIAVRKFYKFLDNKDKDEVKNKIKEEIKLILYNNRLRITN